MDCHEMMSDETSSGNGSNMRTIGIWFPRNWKMVSVGELSPNLIWASGMNCMSFGLERGFTSSVDFFLLWLLKNFSGWTFDFTYHVWESSISARQRLWTMQLDGFISKVVETINNRYCATMTSWFNWIFSVLNEATCRIMLVSI